eukprot:scaffold210971_cov61-Attheya_sp.AAC.2
MKRSATADAIYGSTLIVAPIILTSNFPPTVVTTSDRVVGAFAPILRSRDQRYSATCELRTEASANATNYEVARERIEREAINTIGSLLLIATKRRNSGYTISQYQRQAHAGLKERNAAT